VQDDDDDDDEEEEDEEDEGQGLFSFEKWRGPASLVRSGRFVLSPRTPRNPALSDVGWWWGAGSPPRHLLRKAMMGRTKRRRRRRPKQLSPPRSGSCRKRKMTLRTAARVTVVVNVKTEALSQQSMCGGEGCVFGNDGERISVKRQYLKFYFATD